MNVKEVKELWHAMPFQPIEIVLTNGTAVKIVHPEFMSVSPDGRTLHAWEPTGGGKRIDVKLIIALNELPPQSKRKNRKE